MNDNKYINKIDSKFCRQVKFSCFLLKKIKNICKSVNLYEGLEKPSIQMRKKQTIPFFYYCNYKEYKTYFE
jgi:hypothetical protein